MNGYSYSRAWFNFVFENPEKVSGNHTAMYLWYVELNNRFGWVEKFIAPSYQTMAATGIKSYNTYRKIFNDLTDWGWIIPISIGKNQNSSTIVALSKINKATNKALDKAVDKAIDEALDKATDEALNNNIYNNKTYKHKNIQTNKQSIGADAQTQGDFSNVPSGSKKFTKPTELEISDYVRDRTGCDQIESNRFSAKFFNYYESNGWMVGRSKMKDWKAAVRTWLAKEPIPSEQSSSNNPQHMEKKKYYRNEWDYDLNMWVKKEYDKPLYV